MSPRQLLLSPRPILLALVSAVLLIASFPDFNQPWCAWVALVPWLLLLKGLNRWRAFYYSWLIGFVFFLGSIWWLLHVSVVGWVILCGYLGVYFGLFGSLVVMGSFSHPGRFLQRSSLFQLLYVPALWVALEFARSYLVSGMGWNLLAYSQTSWRHLIQVADVTGAWGVSFLIALANAMIALLVARGFKYGGAVRDVAIVLICIGAAMAYGAWSLKHVDTAATTSRIAVVQGNIPQQEKWDPAYRERILDSYTQLTRAAAETKPELIVWPETSVPGYLTIDEALTRRISSLARELQLPLLVGAPVPRIAEREITLRNSAILVDAAGQYLAHYDKLHLVPFGEFIPFEKVFPSLRNILPPIGEFTPGKEYTVFHLGSRLEAEGSGQMLTLKPPASSLQPNFSVLVCFEDIFPNLVRRFVQKGARLLLVITNDAWFGPTGAAYQHAQASTFRAVELRTPIARAANTGWSGCIDSSGKWTGSVQDSRGIELFVQGTHTCELALPSSKSLYLRWGDWFALLCALIAFCALVLRFR